jgi:hypothetical protein
MKPRFTFLIIFFLCLVPSVSLAELFECKGIWTNSPCENPSETLSEMNRKRYPKPDMYPETKSDPQRNYNNSKSTVSSQNGTGDQNTTVVVDEDEGTYPIRRNDKRRDYKNSLRDRKTVKTLPVQNHRGNRVRRGRR